MYHNYPHKRRVLCLKTLQAALNCCSSRCSLNHCSTHYDMNYWLFVSFLQIKRFCSVGALLYRTYTVFDSSWISAFHLCSYPHLSLLLCSCVRLNPQKHEGQLSVMQLMDMLTGVASGMKYLTEMGFVHKRLAAHKVSEVLWRDRVRNRRKKLWFLF